MIHLVMCVCVYQHDPSITAPHYKMPSDQIQSYKRPFQKNILYHSVSFELLELHGNASNQLMETHGNLGNIRSQ